MQSIEDKILNKIKKCGRGSAFFTDDFAKFGKPAAVNKALERMVNAETIIRITRGIYYYPKIDKKLGLGILYPSLETIAEGIAKRDRARIVPTGTYALNLLGLSTQVPMNLVYLTDGTPRRIKIGKGKGILFKKTAPKNLAFQSKTVMLIVLALKELTEKEVRSEHLEIIKPILLKESKEKVMADLKLMPDWIKNIIFNIYEQID